MKHQEQIERYLHHQMSSNERESFEAAMASDEELAQAVAFQEELMQFFETREPALEAQLSTLGSKYFVKKKPPFSFQKWWLLLPLTILLLFVFKWVFSTKEETPASIEDATTFPPEDSLFNKDTLSTVPTEAIQEEKLPIPESPQKEASSPINRPIASLDNADFRPNPSLEALLHAQYRSEAITEIAFTNMDAVLKKQPKMVVKVKGKSTAPPPYQLVIYSNRTFDFDQDYPMLRQTLATNAQGDVYQFDFNAIISLKKGLYYWIIKTSKEEILYVSSFKVQ